MSEYIKIVEAAKYLKVTRHAIYKQIRRYVIKTKTIDGKLYTTKEWLDDYVSKRDTYHHHTYKNRLLDNPERGEYAISHCAEILGVSKNYILNKINSGKIAAVKRGGYLLILEEEFQKLSDIVKGRQQLELLG